MIDAVAEPGDRLARRLARFRTANPGPGTPRRPPALSAAREPRACAAARRGGRRQGRRGRRGRARASRGGRDRPAGRPSPAGESPRSGAGGSAAGLPRHGDDRSGDGGRHRRLSDRPGLVDGRDVPPGPAAAARPGRGRRPPRPGRAPHPARRLARDIQRTRLRLAPPRHALPDGATRGARSCRPPGPAAARPPALPAPDGRRAARDGRADAARRRPPRRRRRLGDPGRYLGFLRGGPAQPLAAVVRHNGEDVLSLGRLLQHIERGLGDPIARTSAPRGDLAGLARAFRRERRFDEAVDCLDAALAADPAPPPPGPSTAPRAARSPRSRGGHRAGGRTSVAARSDARPAPAGIDRQAFGRPWDEERIAVDRAHLLRRHGPHRRRSHGLGFAGRGPGRVAVVAAIEGAKLREHRLRDPDAAMATVERGLALADRRRARGLPEPALEADLRHRWRRLRLRLAARQASSSAARTGPASASSVGRSNGAGQSNIDRAQPRVPIAAQLGHDRLGTGPAKGEPSAIRRASS